MIISAPITPPCTSLQLSFWLARLDSKSCSIMIPAQSTQTPAPSTSKPALKGDPNNLPKLPIPKLEDTCSRYLRALEGLQDEDEHSKTKDVVKEFLSNGEGEYWQKKLVEYNDGVDSYIEEFWCEWRDLPHALILMLPRRRELLVPRRLCGLELGELYFMLRAAVDETDPRDRIPSSSCRTS